MSPVDDLLGRLSAAGLTLATAESLTGGLLAGSLTSVPGASRVFLGGVVAYATDVKQSVLGVPASLLERHGAVSGECAEAMATGVRELLGASFGISTTGVAGPDEQEGRPVGTVWVGVAGATGATSRLLALPGGRDEVREATCRAAVSLLDGILGREDQGVG
ncbi:nicotinamide-nucleotide amidohydrolase family protein [Nocardioides seonyuensis]|uniref:Nicotinamide-nucleotide amidohydrolase family protein n=1 Tax=Nocardioides seonyuensis TaxID=2518371 RepID=A0A4P7IHM9_9ACTN|nr:nicotinamide-nucleotide amidohydrolase family protein [Nocardioides seonyuensis]QBX56815.1 nicotinamide-nucleotide amidohydrolase family protein [Nocardioides seonyuensis]